MLTKNLNGSVKGPESLRVQRLKWKEPGWERQGQYKEDHRVAAQKTQRTPFISGQTTAGELFLITE